MPKKKHIAARPKQPTAGTASRTARAKESRPRPRARSRPELTAPTERFLRTLQGSARDLDNLLSSVGIALVYVDTQLRLRGFTPAVQDLIDVAPDDLGRPFAGLALKFRDQHLPADLQAVLEQHQPREAEVTTKSGRSYVRRALPYRLGRRPVRGVVVTFMDITRRKLAEMALRTSEERHRLILDGVAEYAIVILDPEGRFVTWTSGAERMLGYTAAEALGQPLTLLYPVAERQEGILEHELVDARSRKNLDDARWHVRKNGEQFWGTGVFSALHDESGRMYGFVKVLRDNTERKLAEERLRQAKIDAELANAAKDRFLANVSHELRTPLSATLLWAKLLTGKAALDPQQSRDGLEAIAKSAREQQALIEDLMDTSRITAGKLRLEMKTVELAPLLRQAAELVRPLVEGNGLRLEISLDPAAGIVRIDPRRMQQVLGNLLNNAVKFTPQGGCIGLRMARHDDIVEIMVHDTGQGISPEFLGRVFERFSQAETPDTQPNGGLGLGLSIARHLVELHGGTIGVHSDGLAKGATFTVRLPCPRLAPASIAPAGSEAPPSLAGLRILLVEDMTETRLALVTALAAAGATVTEAAGAAEALAAFNARRPDLIVSDIGLGKVSGHELLAQIRRIEKNRGLPMVPALALTAYVDEHNRTFAHRSGFQRIVTKPIEPFDLIAAIAALHAAGS